MFYLVYSSEYDADDVVAEFESLEAAYVYCDERGYYSGSDGYCGSYHLEGEDGRVFELPAE